MKITYEQLESLDACEDQLNLFQSLFGEEVEVTRELVITHADKFDWDWAAEKLLPRKKSAEYERVRAPAWAEYERVRAPAWAEYERVRAPAWAEYKRVTAQALAEYKRVTAQALAEYKRVTAQALAEYRIKCAPTFADCAGLV